MDVILLTFDSVNFTMLTESELKKDYEIKVIPTPRAITRSCGLSIVLDPCFKDEMIDKMTSFPIACIWHYTKEGKKENATIIKER